ncbi:MAG: hypothetical protein E7307_04745 [Butyrivibrio sp.]|nr:hypothetical protein [Butyrivibrio sp.]
MSDKDINKKVSDEELENVTGGSVVNILGDDPAWDKSTKPRKGANKDNLATPTQIRYCIKCGKDTKHNVFSGNRMICSVCGTTPSL